MIVLALVVLTICIIAIGRLLVTAIDDLNTSHVRISTALNGIGGEIRKVAEQLANSPTTEQVAAAAVTANSLADSLESAARDIDALVEVAGEDDVTPPPVDPTVPEVEGNADFKG